MAGLSLVPNSLILPELELIFSSSTLDCLLSSWASHPCHPLHPQLFSSKQELVLIG